MDSLKKVLFAVLIYFAVYPYNFVFAQSSSYASAITKQNSLNNEQPLKSFLVNLEKKFQVHFLYETGLLDNIQIDPLKIKTFKGVEFSLKKALVKTNLEYVKVTENTFVIIRSRRTGYISGSIHEKNNQPLVGATIRVLNKNIGSFTDISGNYELALPPGTHQLEVRYVGYKSVVQKISVKPKEELQLHFKLDNYSNLDEVVIVGSRFEEVALLDKTTPVDVFNEEHISTNSHESITNLLQFSAPSFHSTVQNISDGTDHMDPVSLRGLGPDQILVLVNGKRRHPSALVNINGTVGRGTVATDLNAIPTASIKRIEVLRDGASSYYGSDAIAGVINIILKEDTNFLDINIENGITSAGDGLFNQINVNTGAPIGNNGGWLNVTADFTNRDFYNRSGAYDGVIYGDARDNNPDSVQLFFENTGFKNNRVINIGASALINGSIVVNGEIPLNHTLVNYFFGGMSYRQGESTGFYRFPFQKTRQAGISPFGFSPQLHTDIFDQSLTIGLRTRNRKWLVDISNTFGRNSFGFTVKNSNNASLGFASPTRARAGGFAYAQNVTNMDVSNDFDGPIPISIGFGSEFRIERFDQQAGERSSWVNGGDTLADGTPKEIGIQMFPGFTEANEVLQYRHNVGVYASIDADVLKKLRLSGAARYEVYSDFGETFDFRISSRLKLSEQITFRGSWNTGFRAPSLHQVYFSSRATQFESTGAEQIGRDVAHFNNENITTRLFGFGNLQPESSENFSVGLASRPFKNFTFTADYYSIQIDNRIVITGRFDADDDERFAEILNPTGVRSAQFFTNAIDTRTQGFDLGLNYQMNFSNSTLKLRAAANFTETLVDRDTNGSPIIKAPELLEEFKEVLFNREEVARIESAQPNRKIILGAFFQSKKWDANIVLTNFGEVEYLHPDDGDPENWVVNEFTGQKESRDQVFSSKLLTDIAFQYNFTNNVSLKVGGNNVFNVFPDEHTHSANISNGIFLYSRRVQQFGIRGTFWYSKLNLRF